MCVVSLKAGTPAITGGHTASAPERAQSQAEVSTNVAFAWTVSCCSTLRSLRNVVSSAAKHLVMSIPSRQLLHGWGSGVCPRTIVVLAIRLNVARLAAMSARERYGA